MTTSHSAIADLHQAIKSQNPFDRSLVVRKDDVWKPNFPDVPTINAHVSDLVFQSIEQIRARHCSVVGITLRAERGLGKSHLLSRVRNRLKAEGGSFFVYLSETNYKNLNRINGNFLSALSSSLNQIGNQGVSQWQELATAMINEVSNSTYSAKFVLDRFPNTLTQKPRLIEKLTDNLSQRKPEIDPYLMRAVLWTLVPTKISYAVNWLSGKALAQAQADAMGLPNPSDEDKEAEAIQTACQILDLVGDYQTIVVCLDELESDDCNDRGFTRAQVAALLAKDLYSKIKRAGWFHLHRGKTLSEDLEDLLNLIRQCSQPIRNSSMPQHADN